MNSISCGVPKWFLGSFNHANLTITFIRDAVQTEGKSWMADAGGGSGLHEVHIPAFVCRAWYNLRQLVRQAEWLCKIEKEEVVAHLQCFTGIRRE
jgi:hypothetical protein